MLLTEETRDAVPHLQLKPALVTERPHLAVLLPLLSPRRGRRHGAGGEGAAKSSGEGCLGIGSESSHSELALFVPVAIL